MNWLALLILPPLYVGISYATYRILIAIFSILGLKTRYYDDEKDL